MYQQRARMNTNDNFQRILISTEWRRVRASPITFNVIPPRKNSFFSANQKGRRWNGHEPFIFIILSDTQFDKEAFRPKNVILFICFFPIHLILFQFILIIVSSWSRIYLLVSKLEFTETIKPVSEPNCTSSNNPPKIVSAQIQVT